MTTTALATRPTRLAALALVAFTLCFALVVYTLLHEVGHVLVGMIFGQTWTVLEVNLLALSAHVGLVGELTQAQRALQSVAGAALPLMIWIIFICAVPRRSSYLVELLKCIATVTVLSTLLAWIALPMLYRFGQAPIDDVSNFLDYSGVEPLVLSSSVLLIYLVGWLWFFTRIQGVRNEIAVFSTTDRAVIHAGVRRPLALMTGSLIACSGLIIVLSNALNPLAPPQSFQPIAQLDLLGRAYTDEALWQFALDQPAEIGIYAVVQGINTTYFDLRLTGSDGFAAVILHGEDYVTDQDRVTWNRTLPPGQYQLVVTARQTPGTISIYGKDK